MNAPNPDAPKLKLLSVVIPAPFCSLSANAVGGEGWGEGASSAIPVHGEVARFSFPYSVFSFAPFAPFCG
jgi:hypothetical protein